MILFFIATLITAILIGTVLIAEWAIIATKVYEAEKDEADNDTNTIL